jgi:pilus assembly protein CpaF
MGGFMDSAPSPDRRLILEQLLSAAIQWRDAIGAGRLPFDYAVREYVNQNANEVSAAFEDYVHKMNLGEENEHEVTENEAAVLTVLRRTALLEIARHYNYPEVTQFIKGLLESLYYRKSIYWTLNDQAELLRLQLERGQPDAENICAILGPLGILYADPLVVELIVDAPERIHVVYAGSGNRPSSVENKFPNQESLRVAIDRLMALGGVALIPNHPTGEVRLPDGSRVLAVIPPAAVGSAYLYIEKVDPDKFTFSWDGLINMGTLSVEVRDLLNSALQMGMSLLVAGDTPNAKTYLLNLLAESIPLDQRVIVVADSSKLPVARHPLRIHLEPGSTTAVSAAALIELAARMHADWLVTGDLKGEEAMALVQWINAGHPALTTLCAPGPVEALTQIEALCLMCSPNLELAEIRQQLVSAFPLIVFMKSNALPDQRIKVTQIVEMRGLEDNRYLLQPLFAYDNETGRLTPTEAGKSWAGRQRERIITG